MTPLEAASRLPHSVDRAGHHIGSHPPNRARRHAIAPRLVDQEGQVSSPCLDHGLARAVGMTVPVSDTTLTTHASHRPPLRHALLAYLLGGCHSVTSVNDRIGPEAAGRSRLDPTRRTGPRWQTSRRRGRVISSALVAATSDLGNSAPVAMPCGWSSGLPPRHRLWAGGRQVGPRSTGDQQYCCQPKRRGDGDPAQQDASQ